MTYKIFISFRVILVAIFVFICPILLAVELPVKINEKPLKAMVALNDGKKKKVNKKNLSLGTKLDQVLSRKDYNEAESLLNSAFKDKTIANKAILNFRLAKLALLRNLGPKARSYLEALAQSPLVHNTALVSEIYFSMPKEEQQWFAKLLGKWGFMSAQTKSSCPFFELSKRQQRGDILSHIVLTHDLDESHTNEIFRELYLSLPETIDEEKLEVNKKFIAFKKSISIADWVERMNVLMLFGQNSQTQKSYDFALASRKDLESDERCALDYEMAKLKRKMRQYKDARSQFQQLSSQCGNTQIKQKARYMDLMLASMASDSSSIAQCDQFVADYPTHGFSDDVLIFKALILLENDKKDEALSTLEQLIKQFPVGDMIERALFMKAFIYAESGQTKLALPVLKTLKAQAQPSSLAHDQANYWMARLSLFQDLKRLHDPSKENLPAIKVALRSMTSSANPTIYSWLAVKLLEQLGEKPIVTKISKSKAKKLPANKERASLSFIRELVRLDFAHEALALLREEHLSSTDVTDIGAIAELYLALKQPHAGHQQLIRCDQQVAQVLQSYWPQRYAEISWPKPFAPEVQEVSRRVDVPEYVIYPIMRQESGFLPRARSWAQALGLMQIIEKTAQEQARQLKLKSVETKDLFDPKLNLLLGSATFNSYLKRFGHIAVALSAYNAGPVAANKWLAKYRGQPVDTFIENISFRETKAYVQAVLAAVFAYAKRDGLKSLPSLPSKL